MDESKGPNPYFDGNHNGESDEMLEALSDKVRKGEPIGLLEATAVINYQENLRREREENTFVARLKRWLRAA